MSPPAAEHAAPLQAVECLSGHTQSLDFWCSKYSQDGQSSLPISFADCQPCSWQPAAGPALQWATSLSPLPCLVAAASAGPVQADAVLHELGLVLTTASGESTQSWLVLQQPVHQLLLTALGSVAAAGAPGWQNLSEGDAQELAVGSTSPGLITAPVVRLEAAGCHTRSQGSHTMQSQVLQAVAHCSKLLERQQAPWAAVLVSGHDRAPTAWDSSPRSCHLAGFTEHDSLLVCLPNQKYLAYALLGDGCPFSTF